MEQNISFEEFIKNYFPEYKIDSHNAQVISKLSEWALRSPNFNDKGMGWHIDKGISLSGNVGTGKTRMFFLLNSYLNYLKSPYSFSGQIVWKFAEEFKADGYACFKGANEHLKNIYFDELALTDENTGLPTREYVSHYGDKLLIGRELIMQMYNKFENYGYQSHFSTNMPFNDLEGLYGTRAFSRLYQMTNFIALTGEDRRMDESPKFKKNMNNPAPPPPKEIDVNAEIENKKIIDACYAEFLTTQEIPETAALLYNSMVAYGVDVCSEEMLHITMDEVAKRYVKPLNMAVKGADDKERDRNTYIWKTAREWAVRSFFNKMFTSGAKSIFGDVSINLSEVIKNAKPQ